MNNDIYRADDKLKKFQRISFEDLSALSAIDESKAEPFAQPSQMLRSAGELISSLRAAFSKTIDNIFFETACDQEIYAALEKTSS